MGFWKKSTAKKRQSESDAADAGILKDDGVAPGADDAATEAAVVVGSQHIEIERLQAEVERLNSHIDRLETRHDKLLENHAEERRREQTLRQQMQGQIDRLAAQLALPSPRSGEERIRRLEQAGEALAKAQSDVEAAQKQVSDLKGGMFALLKWLEKRS